MQLCTAPQRLFCRISRVGRPNPLTSLSWLSTQSQTLLLPSELLSCCNPGARQSCGWTYLQQASLGPYRAAWHRRVGPVHPISLGLLDSFSLTTTAVFIVFAGNDCQHVKQHAIHGSDHALGEVVHGLSGLENSMAGAQVHRHDCHLLGCNLRLQQPPNVLIKPRKPIYTLN